MNEWKQISCYYPGCNAFLRRRRDTVVRAVCGRKRGETRRAF